MLKVLLADGRARPRRSSREHTDGFDELLEPSSTPSRCDELERQSGATARRHGAVRARCTRPPKPRCSCGRWASPSTRTASDNVARRSSNLGARARQRRPPGRRAHADPRPLRRAGRRRDGRVRDGVPRRRADRRASPRPRSSEQWGFPVPADAGPRPRSEMVEAAGAGRARRALTRAAATSSTCCPTPSSWRRRAGAHAAARAPGHRGDAPDAGRPGRDRRAAAGRDPLRAARAAAPRPPPSGASRSAPRSAGRARRRGADRVGDLRRPRARGSIRSAPTCSRAATRQAIRDEIARVVPVYAGIETLRETGDEVQWGGERLCDGGDFPTPDGRAHFAVGRAAGAPDRPRGASCCSTRRGKQFNSMVCTRSRPAHRRGARRAVHLRRGRAAARRRGRRRGARALRVRRDAGARARRARSAPGNVQVFFPEGNALIRAGERDASGVPDYNAVVEVLPGVIGCAGPAGPPWRTACRSPRSCSFTEPGRTAPAGAPSRPSCRGRGSPSSHRRTSCAVSRPTPRTSPRSSRSARTARSSWSATRTAASSSPTPRSAAAT